MSETCPSETNPDENYCPECVRIQKFNAVMMFLVVIAIVAITSFSGCCATPCVPPPCVAPPPAAYCPAVKEFAPYSDRFPFIDPGNRWRTMSEGEFRDRFHLDSVGVEESR